MLEHLQIWFSIFLSGIQGGINPCALVTLVFFVLVVSRWANHPSLMRAAGWSFLTATLFTVVLLTFGVFDVWLDRPAFARFIQICYWVTGLFFAGMAVLHLRDWRRFKGGHPVSSFKIGLPVFLGSPQPCSGTKRFILLAGAFVLAVFLNVLGSAWGYDYVLFFHFTKMYHEVNKLLAFAHLSGYAAGYVVPLIMVWRLTARWASFQGHERLSAAHVVFIKILFAAVLAGVGAGMAFSAFVGFLS